MAKRLVLWAGVLRRFFLHVFDKKYVKRSIATRRGSCQRCGACCRLVVKSCPSLSFDAQGKSACALYSRARMPNCRNFPIDRRDIRDRDLVSEIPCGFSFDNNEEAPSWK
ncbi:MAG: hypothetical protein FWE09_06760 [Treponema sp.]|nr:hypothetical protein [Treponema sp.]